MWEYFEQNICTDKMVAEFKKNECLPILRVYETRSYFIAKPCVDYGYDFIKSITISYSSTHDEEAEKRLSSDHDVLVNRLKVACKLIEEKYNDQINHIRSMIG